MKSFIRNAIILIILGTIAFSFLVRGAVDRLRDKVMDGFDSAARIISATIGDVLSELDFDSDGVRLPDQFTALLDSAIEAGNTGIGANTSKVSVTDAGFEPTHYEFSADELSALHIDVKNCDIALTSGDYEKLTVDVLENEEFKYNFGQSNGVFTVDDLQSGTEEVKLFGISLGSKKPQYTYDGLVMVICLPESFKGEIDIETANADLKLGRLKLSERLRVKTTDGRLSLSDIEAYDIYADTTLGRIDLERLSATEIFVSTSSDRITLDELTAKRIKAQTTDASIDFSRLFGENFTFETTNGDISGSILGSQLLFHIETLTDRTAIPKSRDNPNAYYKLHAKTVGGDIGIRFVE